MFRKFLIMHQIKLSDAGIKKMPLTKYLQNLHAFHYYAG
jgi:hypothetical protein